MKTPKNKQCVTISGLISTTTPTHNVIHSDDFPCNCGGVWQKRMRFLLFLVFFVVVKKTAVLAMAITSPQEIFNDVAKEFDCSICMSILYNPVKYSYFVSFSFIFFFSPFLFAMSLLQLTFIFSINPCNHVFCAGCLSSWFTVKYVCPQVIRFRVYFCFSFSWNFDLTLWPFIVSLPSWRCNKTPQVEQNFGSHPSTAKCRQEDRWWKRNTRPTRYS